MADTIRVRSHIIQYIRNFLLKDNFLEVQTPVVADNAGGAIARPFTTIATEFSDKQLTLRIAPEIWLKRMILGGMDRVSKLDQPSAMKDWMLRIIQSSPLANSTSLSRI